MPQELPGFYYDEEKNRYFPIKGPIPGSSSRKRKPSPQPSPSKTNQMSGSCRHLSIKSNQLLQAREVCGNMIASREGKLNFQMEYEKRQASMPLIWKYHGTERMVTHALQHTHIDFNTLDGITSADVVMTAGFNGSSVCLFGAERVRQESGHAIYCTPDLVWPLNIGPQVELGRFPRDLRRYALSSMIMPSAVSCIKTLPTRPTSAADASSKTVLITTLGSEASGGSVYNFNITGLPDYSSARLIQVDEIKFSNRTIWTADCTSDGSRAVIGTNSGAYIVNVETKRRSSICHCESDVLSLQVDGPGNVVLCGLRNGAILTLDTRQNPENITSRLARHRVAFPLSKPSQQRVEKYTKQLFELKGNMLPSNTIFMPSSISCLASMKLYDQYFCASSMDGSIKLYDRRLIQRGAVQIYEGNVNSHTRIQFGIDPSERFIMSGGEDCNLRLWSLKSGELLFSNKFTNSAPTVVCWMRTEESQNYDGSSWNNENGAWVGSQEGLYYVDWSCCRV